MRQSFRNSNEIYYAIQEFISSLCAVVEFVNCMKSSFNLENVSSIYTEYANAVTRSINELTELGNIISRTTDDQFKCGNHLRERLKNSIDTAYFMGIDAQRLPWNGVKKTDAEIYQFKNHRSNVISDIQDTREKLLNTIQHPESYNKETVTYEQENQVSASFKRLQASKIQPNNRVQEVPVKEKKCLSEVIEKVNTRKKNEQIEIDRSENISKAEKLKTEHAELKLDDRQNATPRLDVKKEQVLWVNKKVRFKNEKKQHEIVDIEMFQSQNRSQILKNETEQFHQLMRKHLGLFAKIENSSNQKKLEAEKQKITRVQIEARITQLIKQLEDKKNHYHDSGESCWLFCSREKVNIKISVIDNAIYAIRSPRDDSLRSTLIKNHKNCKPGSSLSSMLSQSVALIEELLGIDVDQSGFNLCGNNSKRAH